jgi:deazaflavin-dependent oxidoreductase (nitroreductase family)
MARTFRGKNLLHRIVNPLALTAIRLGIGPKRMQALTVRGRKSGREYTTPVNLVFQDGRRYLVSPYRAGGWAVNAVAAGRVTLSRGGKREDAPITEVAPAEAAPVLRQYLRESAITRPYFDVTPQSSDEAIAAEAPRHPVFLLPGAP